MPEMRFHIEWPDGEQESCYSPSLVIKEHLEVGASYDVDDFAVRCATALEIAGERVRQKFGFSCSLAEAESSRITARATRYQGQAGAKVRVLKFTE